MRQWLRRYRRSLGVFGAAALIDVALRIALGFDVGHVIPAEAAVFLVAAMVLLWAAGKDRTESRRAARVDLWLAAAFTLGGLRLVLWGAGLPVHVANVVILVLGFLVGVLAFVRHRTGNR